MTVFIAHATADARVAQGLQAFLKSRAFLAELEPPHAPARPLQRMDARVVLWSRATMMDAGRLLLERRALEAWAGQGLVLVKLDHGFLPVGLRDLPTLDASFEARRDFTWGELAQGLRGIAPPQPSAIAPGGKGSWFGGLFSGRKKAAAAEEDHAAAVAAPSPSRGETAAGADISAVAPTPPVFISYSSKDKDRVLPTVDLVARQGLPVWIDREGLKSGQNWAGEIVAAIRRASRVAVMCSAHAFESPHVRREVYLAGHFTKPLLPVFLEEAAPPDEFLYHFADVQWLRLFASPEPERAPLLAQAFNAIN